MAALLLMYFLVVGVFIIYPLWRIFRRAGLDPVLSLLIFVPFFGVLMVSGLLAFRRWPATEPAGGGA